MINITSKSVSIAFGVAFLAAGLLGFIPNPVVAPDGLFEVNFMHNLVHVLTAAVFFFGASRTDAGTRTTIQSVGMAYVGIAILGFVMKGDMLLGLVHINHADKWLHAGLALVIVVAGFVLPKPRLTQPQSA